jgi:SAM-dependent methyltransferase
VHVAAEHRRPRAALREVARLLAPGGRFAFVTAHPFSTIEGARRVLGAGSYFAELRFGERRERDGLSMTFADTHRPLRSVLAAVLDAGLVIESLDEPVPDDAYVEAHPEVGRWRADPVLLAGRARKPR